MPRYRFVCEYLGTPFSGWQKQPKDLSVQQTLEEAFAQCLREPVSLVGSGRTDAGVHASGQVVHFDFSKVLDAAQVTKSVNALTPPSVAIRGFQGCEDDFHARYSALSRYYQYHMVFRPMPLRREQTWYVYHSLEPGLFSAELKKVGGTHDFAPFSIPRGDGKSTLCTVSRCELEVREGAWVVHLEANRFLHKMVRSIVGACYDVARGHSAPGLVESVFRGKAGERTWAPPGGLRLMSVRYPGFSS